MTPVEAVVVRVRGKAPAVAKTSANVTFLLAAKVKTSPPPKVMALVLRVVESETVNVLEAPKVNAPVPVVMVLPLYVVAVKAPEIFKPPAPMVEARVVLVALKLPNVGVDVATICPKALVERRELIATELNVRDGAVIEEVAVKTEAITEPPSKYPEPATDSLYPGVVEPMPTLPDDVILICSVKPASLVAEVWNTKEVGRLPADTVPSTTPKMEAPISISAPSVVPL